MKISVIIPAYNEAQTIEEIVHRVLATGIPEEIVVIDDGSTDETPKKLKALDGKGNLRVLFHERNQGKGAAGSPK